MPIFHHRNYPMLGHSRGMSSKFMYLFVQIPDYFSFFYAYIMFIYCHTVNKNWKIQKEIIQKWKILGIISWHFISLHVIHISCCMVKYSFPDSILELKMKDSLKTRINIVEHIQEEFRHDIQEIKGQLARLTKLIEGHTGIMPKNIHGSPSFPLQPPLPFFIHQRHPSHQSRMPVRGNVSSRVHHSNW